MIAALFLVALVAAAGQAAPSHAEVQPFWGGDIAGLKELGCLIDSAKKFAALAPEVHAHRAEILTAAVKLGSKLTRCVAVEDKLTCFEDELEKFVASDEIDADVKALAQKAIAIRNKLMDCIVPEEVTLLAAVEPFWGGEIAGLKDIACIVENAKKLVTLVPEVRAHAAEVITAFFNLGEAVRDSCAKADDQFECAVNTAKAFLQSDEVDASVRAIYKEVVEIRDGFKKCRSG